MPSSFALAICFWLYCEVALPVSHKPSVSKFWSLAFLWFQLLFARASVPLAWAVTTSGCGRVAQITSSRLAALRSPQLLKRFSSWRSPLIQYLDCILGLHYQVGFQFEAKKFCNHLIKAEMEKKKISRRYSHNVRGKIIYTKATISIQLLRCTILDCHVRNSVRVSGLTGCVCSRYSDKW